MERMNAPQIVNRPAKTFWAFLGFAIACCFLVLVACSDNSLADGTATPPSIGGKMAAIDGLEINPENSDLYDKKVSNIAGRFAMTPEQVGDQTAGAKKALNELGFHDSLMDLMSGMEKVIPGPMHDSYALYLSMYAVSVKDGEDSDKAWDKVVKASTLAQKDHSVSSETVKESYYSALGDITGELQDEDNEVSVLSGQAGDDASVLDDPAWLDKVAKVCGSLEDIPGKVEAIRPVPRGCETIQRLMRQVGSESKEIGTSFYSGCKAKNGAMLRSASEHMVKQYKLAKRINAMLLSQKHRTSS